MSKDNKRNIHYFEGSSMHELFSVLQNWQNENDTRFLSIGVEKDGGKFCCIALTNPTEVVITGGNAPYTYASVNRYGQLEVTAEVTNEVEVSIMD